jgi:hypothetical protein
MVTAMPEAGIALSVYRVGGSSAARLMGSGGAPKIWQLLASQGAL